MATPLRRIGHGYRARRGFTLVELLVAMAAGLVVAAAAFLLSKNATTFFQHEARISTAQLSATLGMARLSADLQRASFMSTPNIQRDPTRCGAVPAAPVGLTSLAGIRLEEDGSTATWGGQLYQSTINGFEPDRILIGGSFSTTEQFPTQFIDRGGGGGHSIYLQTDAGAMARVRAGLLKGGDDITTIFAAGKMVRVVDLTGRPMFGVIAGTNISGTNIIVQLEAGTPLQEKLDTNDCGVTGLGIGLMVNPISRVRYELRSLVGDPIYNSVVNPPVTTLTAAQKTATGDVGRTELVRTELDAFDAPVSTELVAEYAVDLKFGLTIYDGTPKVLSRFPLPMTAANYVNGGDVSVAGTPEKIRAVQVRLSTRARAPDRTTSLPTGPDGRLGRFLVDAALPPPAYARMRTLYADISLPNQAGIPW
jgi:prepilin-type N-terminal cleavage/methylation domain-containing protein